MSKKEIIFIFFFIIVLFLYCGKKKNYQNIEIVHGLFNEPFILDPSKINDKISCNILPQIFETLTSIENNGNIVSKLAKKWGKSEDNLSYNFYIQPNIKFHDGNFLTAEDVKISFLRQYDKNCIYYYNNPPNIFENLLKNLINSINTIDSLTISINLKYPNSLFFYLISSPYVSPIVSLQALKKYGNKFGENPIGTGPFKLLKENKDNKIILTPFKEYWGKIPTIKELRFKFGRADNLENQALNDSIDVLSRISGNNIDKFISSNKFEFFIIRPETIYFLGFNLNKNEIKNRNLRKSILLSVDRNGFVYTINRTNAIVADGPLPEGIFNSINLIKQENCDLEKAKNILKKLLTNVPELKLIAFEDNPRAKIYFELLINYLTRIGLRIEKNYYTKWEDFENAKRQGDYDLILDGWGADVLGDPYFFLYDLFYSKSSFNVFHYKNERVDKLLDEAVQTFDRDKRNKMYEEINNIIIEDIPAVFISQIKDIFVINKRIKNVKINPYRYIEYKDVVIE